MYLFILTIFISVSLFILGLLVFENQILTKRRKFFIYCLIGLLILSYIFDISSHYLTYSDIKYKTLHTVMKGLDMIFTPFVAYFYSKQLKDNLKLEIPILATCSINAILVFISLFVPYIFYIDDNNNYQNGPCFFLYLITLILCMVYVFISLFLYGKSFKRRNYFSLIIIFLSYVASAIIEYYIKEDLHIARLVLVLCTYLIFIHQNEYTFQEYDKIIENKEYMLQIDPLTKLYSRYAYTKMLSSEVKMDDKTIVFSMDLNGLKSTNDELGHSAGDELLKGVSKCIQDVLGPYGPCFRTGGDEFIAILEITEKDIEKVYLKLLQSCKNFSGEFINTISLSIGYARHNDYKDLNIEKLIQEADIKMYIKKKEYYSSIEKK